MTETQVDAMLRAMSIACATVVCSNADPKTTPDRKGMEMIEGVAEHFYLYMLDNREATFPVPDKIAKK